MSNLLEKARLIINDVDKKMAELFVERMRAAEMVAEHKKANGLQIFDPAREAEVIRRGSEAVEDDVLRAYYVNFLKSTMAISRSYQASLIEGMAVAYSGSEGAFAHIATEKLFPSARKIAFPNFESAYEAVVRGECDAAVLPMENSTYGEVGQVTDLMFSGTLYVNTVAEMDITHDLVGIKGATVADIKTVVSHPQALGQCHEFIKQHGFTEIEYANTALAARLVSEKGDKSIAAIASAEAAERHGLSVIEYGINTTKNNTTRFAVLSRSMNKHGSKEMGVHTILLFTVRNEAGALARAIDIIGRHGFNMRTLRSRPMKDLLWQYYFYVEAEGNINTDEGQAMLRELSEYCDRLRAVGTYTKGEGTLK